MTTIDIQVGLIWYEGANNHCGLKWMTMATSHGAQHFDETRCWIGLAKMGRV